jgi:DNA-directed RNA polymerase specialized sigma24 family protein
VWGLSSSSSSDARLIGVSVSEPQLFATLFDRHGRAIWRYACRRAGLEAADEIVSETFLRAFSSRAAYDARQPDARPWLYGIATNVLREHARDAARSRRDADSYEQIAIAMQVPVGTVRSRLNRARRLMQAQLGLGETSPGASPEPMEERSRR